MYLFTYLSLSDRNLNVPSLPLQHLSPPDAHRSRGSKTFRTLGRRLSFLFFASTNVDEQLRAAVRRLAYVGEKMAPLPEACTFTVAVELRDEAQAPIGHPQPWVPTQPNLQTVSRDQKIPGEDVGGAKTTPLRAVEAGPLFFECWVEEGKAKLDPPSTMSSNE
ncbi:hypothetical protein NUW58_g10384 [Xylaria curta]|uniref:Uncharacterized protein n=1 Tax=Xylaria curta TaxID=42375 RepID=A0ACC1MMF9_9PEZI|nr:hypothetical protein NUW58_g10384 [Xylaria curta]